ncbi:MAG: hypothetical protein M3Q45_03775 [Chloroflexota bacterium]|nr:hypothetical protein [Chloroflexota bacterium]
MRYDRLSNQLNEDESILLPVARERRVRRGRRCKTPPPRRTAPPAPCYTGHGWLRKEQRGLTQGDIDYVLRFGMRFYAAGAIIYFLRAVDIAAADSGRMKRLEGTAIFIAREHPAIITVWRNRQHGMRNIRRKLAVLWAVSQ